MQVADFANPNLHAEEDGGEPEVKDYGSFGRSDPDGTLAGALELSETCVSLSVGCAGLAL
jgi:hypothetical protein